MWHVGPVVEDETLPLAAYAFCTRALRRRFTCTCTCTRCCALYNRDPRRPAPGPIKVFSSSRHCLPSLSHLQTLSRSIFVLHSALCFYVSHITSSVCLSVCSASLPHPQRRPPPRNHEPSKPSLPQVRQSLHPSIRLASPVAHHIDSMTSLSPLPRSREKRKNNH